MWVTVHQAPCKSFTFLHANSKVLSTKDFNWEMIKSQWQSFIQELWPTWFSKTKRHGPTYKNTLRLELCSSFGVQVRLNRWFNWTILRRTFLCQSFFHTSHDTVTMNFLDCWFLSKDNLQTTVLVRELTKDWLRRQRSESNKMPRNKVDCSIT